MAGLGGSCCHVAAVLFYFEYTARLQENKTVNQDKAHWVPPALKELEYNETTDIDFISSKSIKRQMDLRLQDASKSHQPTSSCSNQNSFASDQELDDFFCKLGFM